MSISRQEKICKKPRPPKARRQSGLLACGSAHDYANPGFKLSLGFKDANLVLAAADRARVPMPLAGMMHDRFLAAMAKERGELDRTAAALNVSEDAGLR